MAPLQSPRLLADAQRAADVALLDQVIAGTLPDLLEPELADQLEAVFNRYPEDAAMLVKWEEALAAYEQAALKATESL